ncbi:MAG: rhodanese-like domain-containing protein, partial [Planctomycetota bacterium]|nr:rhodanese-like domain-containing protein [Planctomycetota bacterium]
MHSWLSAGQAVLIDVREPDEHARERIDTARLCPLSRFDPANVIADVPPGKIIVLHCKGGKRSADAAAMLCGSPAARGRVVSLSGGIEAWKQSGLATEANSAAPRLSIMRQTQLVIGAFVAGGSALAWFVDPRIIAIPAFFGLGLVFAGASGTCALASLIAKMPWNRIDPAASS